MSETRRPSRRKTSIRKGGRDEQRPRRDPDRFVQVTLTPRTKALLRRFELAPRKGLGQNFLVDEFVLDDVIRAAELESTDAVVEVGPGLGVLTSELANRVARVAAVEMDPGMAAALRDLFKSSPNVAIVEADALKVEPAELIGDGPYKLVANIPYYITSRLLRHFFESKWSPSLIVVMVQREVAERIVATAGDLSLLAVSVQYYGEPRIVGRVPAQAFYPQPKVDSAILRVDVREKPAVDVPPKAFFKTVSAGFAQPRKQLHNAIGQEIWLPPGGAVEVLTAAGIDPMRRAQTVTLEEWATLTRELLRRGAV